MQRVKYVLRPQDWGWASGDEVSEFKGKAIRRPVVGVLFGKSTVFPHRPRDEGVGVSGSSEAQNKNAGAFLVSHALIASCDPNSAISMLSMVGPLSPTFLISSSLISRMNRTR